MANIAAAAADQLRSRWHQVLRITPKNTRRTDRFRSREIMPIREIGPPMTVIRGALLAPAVENSVFSTEIEDIRRFSGPKKLLRP
jgi:hypothetical protein